MAGRMETFGLSDTGLVRQRNEDQFLIADLKKSVIIHQTSLSYDDETHLMGGSQAKLLLVADGISDDAEGERASRMAVQGIVQYLLNTMHWLFRLNDGREEDFLEDLRSALVFTQEKIQQFARSAPFPSRQGANITLAYVVWPQLYLLHSGNSRASVFREGQLMPLTTDQAAGNEAADDGLEVDSPMSPRALPHSLHRTHLGHVFSGLVGHNPVSRPEVTPFKLALGDRLLLSTDGLTKSLNDSEIAELLAQNVTAEEGCRMLIKAANSAGGVDNTTVVLADFFDQQTQRLKSAFVQVSETLSAAATTGNSSTFFDGEAVATFNREY